MTSLFEKSIETLELPPGEACGCGLDAPYLTILGRAGLNDITTCAAGAAELLGKGEGF